MMTQATGHPLKSDIRQSPPIDFSQGFDDGWIRDKTILITGGASGFGRAWFKKWAAVGAAVIIGDINVKEGDQLVRDVKKETGNSNLHFFYCDVTDWQSQVQFFKDAVRMSPHGGIDTVIANAGILDREDSIQKPEALDAAEPPAPRLAVLDVNLTGVVYTVHLALFYLARNPGSFPSSPDSSPVHRPRDRHLLLVSSMAGILPLPGNTLYSASKHAVVGLFRTLRTSTSVHGIRVNMLCPYFVDTPMFPAIGRVILGGGVMAKPEDVVEAATRLIASPFIVGKAIAVGPKLRVKQVIDGEWDLVGSEDPTGGDKALWEPFADDWEDSEPFSRNYVRLMNRAAEIRGWMGWLANMFASLRHGLGWS